MGPLDEGGVVVDRPVARRVLQQGAKDGRRDKVEALVVADDHLDAEGQGAGAHDSDRLGVAGGGDEEGAHPRLRLDPIAHRHRLGRRRRLVEQRGVGDLKTGEVDHHRLEVEQRLQAALGDLGLVGRVLGVPAGIFKNVALDDRRGDTVVVAQADIGAIDLILRGKLLQLGEHRVLARRLRQLQGASEPNRPRHRPVDERVKACTTERIEHLAHLLGARTEVAVLEMIAVVHGRAHRFRGRRRPGCRNVGRVAGSSVQVGDRFAHDEEKLRN